MTKNAMESPRIVFHCADQKLFDGFIQALPRRVLTDYLRKDQSLRTRRFRGRRVSKDRPDAASISKAYYREINSDQNFGLLYYLCEKWVASHEDVASAVLASIGLGDIDLTATKSWLRQSHGILNERGHVSVAREIVRDLAFDHRVESILIMISILSVDCEDQADLRRNIEDEFRIVRDDPRALSESLIQKRNHFDANVSDLRERDANETKKFQSDRDQLALDLKRLQEKRDKKLGQLEKYKRAHSELKLQFDTIRSRLDDITSKVKDGTTSLTKMDNSISVAQRKMDERAESYAEDNGRTKAELAVAEKQHADVSKRLEEAEKRIAVHAQETAKHSHRGQGATEESSAKGPAVTVSNLRDFVGNLDSAPSTVTLDLLSLSLTPPESTPADREHWRREASLPEYPPWSSDGLSRYALSCSRHHIDTAGTRAELAIGGLYHAAGSMDASITGQLLAELVLCIGGKSETPGDGTDLGKIFDHLDNRVTEPAVFKTLGELQTKLATSNPNALIRLYDEMTPRFRLVAKRALIAKVQRLGFQDHDPTHEILDQTISYLETLLGPVTNCLHLLGEQGVSLRDFRQHRQRLMASSDKLFHVFSVATNNRLTHFRDLLGAHLTEVLDSNTMEKYDRFGKLALQYCQRECSQPEWISSHYLFPIVLSAAEAASTADKEIRKLRPEVSATLDKQQHPLNTARKNVPLRIQINNTGDAPAKDVVMEVEADRREITVRPREMTIRRIGPGQTVLHDALMDVESAVQAMELTCLFRWRNPDASEQSYLQPSLKLTAQREVSWAEAGATPYPLRSVTSRDRLVGRDSDLDALCVGVEGKQSFYITGQKRVGKTSVARVLTDLFRHNEQYVSVYQTIGDSSATSGAALVHSLYGLIVDELEDISDGALAVTLPPVEEFINDEVRQNQRFRRKLDKALAGRNVLCVVDDFDEISEELYKGDGAKSFFLRLRSLIDSGCFAFVFVGSEKLPVIFRYQGEKLNQVREHSLNYLRDDAALRRLVVEPCKRYLDYSDRAVDVIRDYSAGNPYYATHICAKVYEDMYIRRDHYVAEGDVLRSIERICEGSGVNDFQHLWTDGVFEGGADSAEMQYLNALVEVACARGGTTDADFGVVERDWLMDQDELRTYDPAIVRHRLDNLVHRGVLVQRGGSQIGLRVPLFRRWLRKGGEAAVRASFGGRDLRMRFMPVEVGPPAREVVELADGLVYQGQPVGVDRVRAWLEQFGFDANQKLAFAVLKRLKGNGYFSDVRIHQSCKTLHQIMLQEFASTGGFAQMIEKGRTRNLFFSSFDDEAKSGGRILYS